MEAISGCKAIQEIAADHPPSAAQGSAPFVATDPAEPVETEAARWRQRAGHHGQEDQGQGRVAGQGGGPVPADRTSADGARVAQKKSRLL